MFEQHAYPYGHAGNRPFLSSLLERAGCLARLGPGLFTSGHPLWAADPVVTRGRDERGILMGGYIESADPDITNIAVITIVILPDLLAHTGRVQDKKRLSRLGS